MVPLPDRAERTGRHIRDAHEMATSKVAMALLISAGVWGVMPLVVSIQEKKALGAKKSANWVGCHDPAHNRLCNNQHD